MALRDPQQEQRQRQPATPPGIDTDSRTSERLREILYRADPAHRAAYQRGARCRDEDQGDPEDTANDEPEHPRDMRLNQGQVDEDEDDLENAPPSTGGEPGRADVHRHRSIAPSVAWHRDASHGRTLQGTRTGAGKRPSDGVWTEIDSARSAPANVMLFLRRPVLATVGNAEFAVCYLFYFRPHLALTVLGRPVLDTVISRQYGLFLASVALMYGIVALNPVDYRRFIWIAPRTPPGCGCPAPTACARPTSPSPAPAAPSSSTSPTMLATPIFGRRGNIWIAAGAARIIARCGCRSIFLRRPRVEKKREP